MSVYMYKYVILLGYHGGNGKDKKLIKETAAVTAVKILVLIVGT